MNDPSESLQHDDNDDENDDKVVMMNTTPSYVLPPYDTRRTHLLSSRNDS